MFRARRTNSWSTGIASGGVPASLAIPTQRKKKK